MKNRAWYGLMVLLLSICAGCTTTNSFTTAARAGDTIALPLGWQTVSRQNLTVTITPVSVPGPSIVYAPGDAHIRAVINLYPDPVSRIVIGTRTNQALGSASSTWGMLVNGGVTSNDTDWSEVMAILDLPTSTSLPPGSASISVSDGVTNLTPTPIAIEILPGTGSPNSFSLMGGGVINDSMWKSVERAEKYTVTFSGAVLPNSIQLTIPHTPATGVPWIANPIGDLKSIVWSDNGSNLNILITPTTAGAIKNLIDYKFYIAGGIAGLPTSPTTLKAYDANGNPIAGITASIQ